MDKHEKLLAFMNKYKMTDHAVVEELSEVIAQEARLLALSDQRITSDDLGFRFAIGQRVRLLGAKTEYAVHGMHLSFEGAGPVRKMTLQLVDRPGWIVVGECLVEAAR